VFIPVVRKTVAMVVVGTDKEDAADVAIMDSPIAALIPLTPTSIIIGMTKMMFISVITGKIMAVIMNL
jgi:hypothetical protein